MGMGIAFFEKLFKNKNVELNFPFKNAFPNIDKGMLEEVGKPFSEKEIE